MLPWPAPVARWRCRTLPWINVVIEHAPPRGVGSVAAAALLLASVCYGVVKGDHVPVLAANLQRLCDSASNAAGFHISTVALAGRHDISRSEILHLAGVTNRSSLLCLDARAARARLLTDPWIADAAVLKLYPGRLHITIKERRPFALWQEDRHVSLIAADGTVLEPYVPLRFQSLPLVVGKGAQRAADDFLRLVDRYPLIARQVQSSVLVADRRWTLYFKNGVQVLLPEDAASHALRILVDLNRSKKLLSRDIVKVDLRLADRVTVQLSDAAAAARDEAIKAAEKARKAKRKKDAAA